MDYKILRLTDQPEFKEQAARWFHEKWRIPLEAYMEKHGGVPGGEGNGSPVVYGVGRGEDHARHGSDREDFHDRKDLAPNVCAVYTEEDWRGQGRCRLRCCGTCART